MQKILLKVRDMHCSSCVMRLEGLEDDLAGVVEVNGSYQKQTLEVKFDEQRVSVEQIQAAVRALGYTPETA